MILTNNDSLTVSLRAAQIQVKTQWGEANINVPHLKSLLLTSDDVQWQEAGGRWTLVAVEKPTPPVAEDAGEIAPAAPPQESADERPRLEGADATIPGPAPGLTIPPADTRPTDPKLPPAPNPT
ncbi:MAG: hypothetical protein L0211_21175 [Planctomycetaceae bacterium]|nr:hypothetical protein [Planctomycetaceae bacterium]